jgi:hypothetical protein
VAIMVVAIPFTGVSALPAIRLSTVCSAHGIPTFFFMRAITSPTVSVAGVSCAFTDAALNSPTPAAISRRRDRSLLVILSSFRL